MRSLNARAFNNLLGVTHRQDVIWRRADKCPCASRESGHAKVNCPVCGGIGWMWAEGKRAWTGLQGMKPSTSVAMFGAWDGGDSLLTIPSDSPLYAAGRYDRIQVGDAAEPFSTVIVPGLVERLMGVIVSIDRVFWLDGDKIVEGPTPEVDRFGKLSWSGARPPEGVSFTVTGRKKAEMYLFKDLPGNRNSGASGLPRKVTARSFDLLGRTGTDAQN